MNGAGPPDTIYCQQCGQELRSDAQFCDRCGAEQTTHQTPTAPAQGPTATPDTSPEPEQPRVSRRGIFTAGGIVSVGIFGGGLYWASENLNNPPFELATNAWSDVENYDGNHRTQRRARLELTAGEYTTADLELTDEHTLDIEVAVESGSLDVLTFPHDEFQRYREQKDDARSVSALSMTGVTTENTVTGSPGAGEYVIVYDNTAPYGSEPDGAVTAGIYEGARLVSEGFFDFFDAVNDLTGVSDVGTYNDRRSWLVGYRSEGLSDETVADELQTIFLEYVKYVPIDEGTHTELLVSYQGDGSIVYTVPKDLALDRKNGSISQEEYFDAIRNNRTG